jgi:ATP-binding protein involved in chromosome partitioning
MALAPKTISDILKKVKYPGTNEAITERNMVQEIRIAANRISFSLVLQQENDPNLANISEECISEIHKN